MCQMDCATLMAEARDKRQFIEIKRVNFLDKIPLIAVTTTADNRMNYGVFRPRQNYPRSMFAILNIRASGPLFCNGPTMTEFVECSV